MIVAVPAPVPVTTPVVEFIVAMPVALLLQVPPAVASVSVIVWPWHTTVGPAIATGKELTVITCVT